MMFWIIAVALCFLVASLLGVTLLRGQPGQDVAHDVQLYRDQLAELDRDLARGVLSAEDAERTRIEVSRRLLAADGVQHMGQAAKDKRVEINLGLALVFSLTIAGSVALYASLGQPDLPDVPLAQRLDAARQQADTRPSQAQYEAQIPAQEKLSVDPETMHLINQLREIVKEDPTDINSASFLARNEALIGNYAAAYELQEYAISLKSEAATAADYLTLAEHYIFAAQGYVSPEAELALHHAARLDPQNGFARYYQGLLLLQTGRADLTFRVWSTLLAEGPENAPWIAPIRTTIDDLAWVAGVPYEAPAPKGPTASDIAAAQNLSVQDRADMIEGMVASLSERLATEGGPVEDWAQLITALGVLGRNGDAGDILAEARDIFSERPQAISVLESAAQAAGLE